MKSIFHILQIIIVGMIMVSCGGQTSEDQSKDVTTDETTTQTTPIQISNQDVLIHHQISGKGDYTLLFVHGWCINQSYWSDQIEALSDQYKIVTIDLPGFGESGKNRGDWTIENYGKDINTVIDQLQLKNVILIGHSMGGDVILEAARANSDIIALIGIDNFKEVGIEYNDDMIAEVEGFINLMKTNFDEVSSAYAAEGLFPPDTDSLIKARVIQDFKSSDSTIAIAALENLFAYTPKEFEQLKSLKQKLYLINSDTTPTNKEGLDSTGVDYEVIDIEGTGHYPMIEKSDEFTRLLSETIGKIVTLSKGS